MQAKILVFFMVLLAIFPEISSATPKVDQDRIVEVLKKFPQGSSMRTEIPKDLLRATKYTAKEFQVWMKKQANREDFCLYTTNIVSYSKDECVLKASQEINSQQMYNMYNAIYIAYVQK